MNILRQTIEVPGLTKEYSFLHITDMHIILIDEDFSNEKKEVYTKRKNILFKRHDTMPEDKLHEMIDYCVKENLMPVFSGDIFDFPSKSNFELIDKEFSRLKDFVFVLGNHEWSYMDCYQGLCKNNDYRTKETFEKYYHLFEKYSPTRNSKYFKKDMGEFLFVCFDNCDEGYSGGYNKEQVKFLKECISLNKPIIIVGHVPFYEEDMYKPMQDFAPGYLNACAYGQKLVPLNGEAKEIRNLILDPKNKIIAFLAGHIHCTVDTKIGGLVPQFTLGGSYEGDARLFTLKPKK